MCNDLKSKHDALVLVITEGKDVFDEVRCLDAGVDDYLRKPFFPDQLLARIRAVARRARSTVKLPPSSHIYVGPLCIDPLHNTVSIRGKTIQLTPTEGKMLTLLAANANAVCTARQIVVHVWGYGDTGDSVLIKTHIYHLRQKIEPDPTNPLYILTVPGVGYTLVRRSEQVVDAEFENPLQASLVASG
jgi:DNA-binding response OmpR family regulator